MSLKDSIGAGTIVRKGAPDSVWQSAQLQIITFSGSIRAEKETLPQWQAPLMFIVGAPEVVV
ncbi:MAG TPA: hypothetical protein PLC34_12250 [Burkholderiaceae bacterium]|nr:hypothetical protein [Burkholderiaceae bacterium]